MSQLTPTALELRTMLLLSADTYTQPQYSKKGKYVPCFTYHSDPDPPAAPAAPFMPQLEFIPRAAHLYS